MTRQRDLRKSQLEIWGRRFPGRGLSRSEISGVPVGRWLVLVVLIAVLIALVGRIPPHFGAGAPAGISVRFWLLDLLIVTLLAVVLLVAMRLTRQRRTERARESATSGYVDTIIRTSKEWHWGVDLAGMITFSSPMCEQLVGYRPEELIGSPVGLVLDPDDLAEAVRTQPEADDLSAFAALVLVCQHRDGRRIVLEVSGNAVLGVGGEITGYEGIARSVEGLSPSDKAAAALRKRIDQLISSEGIKTAFQPICWLATGEVVGAEALSRFPSSDATSPEAWFLQAAAVGKEADLELLALRTALNAASGLPSTLFVTLNVSPTACLDPRITEALLNGPLERTRLVLEITERQEITNYDELDEILEPLRAAGVKIAIDDAGAGFASMRHIIKLRPDLIKLDRSIIKEMDTDAGHRALGVAMEGLAAAIGASPLAEGIETERELQAVRELGMEIGQGYLLGKPSLDPAEWASWVSAEATPPNSEKSVS